jgi:rhamnogalacturonyl hydrolase YesR
MKKHCLTSAAILLASVCGVAWSAEPAASPPHFPPPPQYPIPYAPPTVEQVSQVMQRVLKRLDTQAPIRLVDRKTHAEVKDFSKPNPDAQLDKGPEGKFPPIAYPMGVIYSGMLAATEATGDKAYADFVVKRYQFFADHYKDFQAWGDGRENPFRNFYRPGNLDACGAMVASMVRAKRMHVGPDLTPIIETAAKYVHTKQQRLDDGTFCRPGPFPKSLWLDDAYMSVPLLAQYGALTGDRAYFDDAATQLKGFYKHLFIPARGVFTHAATADNEADHPIHCWGRANGWFMVATVDLLDLLPEDHSDRPALIKILREHARGVASLQSGTGLWHQVLDRQDSYLETSCTAMFTYAMAKAVNRGWLDPGYAPVAVAGWNGLTTKVDAEGRVNDVCIGTNYADDFVYYYNRPAIDDIHGYGPVLLAGAEVTKLMKDPRFKWESGRDKPNLVHPAAQAK